MSKSKGRKEKEIVKNQAKVKKQIAVDKRTNTASTSQTMLGGLKTSEMKKRVLN